MHLGSRLRLEAWRQPRFLYIIQMPVQYTGILEEHPVVRTKAGLFVEEAMMTEPTESESKETMDEFAKALITIAAEIEQDPQQVINAPHTIVVSRLDEAAAARKPNVRWKIETNIQDQLYEEVSGCVISRLYF